MQKHTRSLLEELSSMPLKGTRKRWSKACGITTDKRQQWKSETQLR